MHIDDPKSEKSRRVLALGRIVDRYREWIAKKDITAPDAWPFSKVDDPTRPMWVDKANICGFGCQANAE